MPVQFYTASEVAEICGLSRQRVLMYCKAGRIGMQWDDEWYIHPEEAKLMKTARSSLKVKTARSPTMPKDAKLVMTLIASGKSIVDVAKLTKIPRSRVYRLIGKYKMGEEVERLRIIMGMVPDEPEPCLTPEEDQYA